jgi:hypothetical protein
MDNDDERCLMMTALQKHRHFRMRREERLDNGDMSVMPLQPQQLKVIREDRLDSGDKSVMPLQPLQFRV